MAVVSWAYWQTRFNRDPAILGRQIVLNGVPARVIGVAPREFFGLRVGFTPDVWVPAAMETLIQRPSRRATGDLPLGLMARLKPGVSIEQAQAEMRVLDQRRVEELAKATKNPVWRQASIYVEPAGGGLSRLRDHLATPLLSLTAIVACSCCSLHERRRHDGGARRVAPPRNGDARRARRRSRPAGPAGADRIAAAVNGGRSARGVLAYFGAGALVRSWLSTSTSGLGTHTLELDVHPDPQVLLFTAGLALLTASWPDCFPRGTRLRTPPATSLREIGVAGETKSRRLSDRAWSWRR